jgi:cytosine/adenosine deaminase-related metal-dependent hydrolase
LIPYRAAWVLPIDRPPVPGGVVTVDRGRIVRVAETADGVVEDLGRVAVLPGLVNAHTHLELSWMRDLVPPAACMPAWAATLIEQRRAVSPDPPQPIFAAIAEARAAGTSLVGDVSNTLAAYQPLLDSELFAAIFCELVGFAASDPESLVAGLASRIAALPSHERLRASIVPHAPYSVSPDLFRAIARYSAGRPISVHVGESSEEIQFLRDASGAWRDLLESLGVWDAAWPAPSCGPIAYLDRLGLLTANLIAVHGVQLTDAELGRLASVHATLVTCPRSNRWTGAGAPPLDRFYASGVRVAVGTDSLASVDSLNMLAELAEMRRLAPRLPARALLESATRAGADALGFGSELGTLQPGARAQVIAVRVPAGIEDVEEYLVSGIEPGDVTWLRGG